MGSRALPKAIRITLLVGSVAGLAALLSGYAAEGAIDGGCSAAPQAPSVELAYRLEAGTESVTAATREESVGIVCGRLLAAGIGKALVELRGARHIGVTLPQLGVAKSRRAIELAAASGRIYFYNWEQNLIGRERALGGHPGRLPPPRALREANREWRLAGRAARRPAYADLVAAGALPTLYSAVKLASEQRPRRNCSCPASTPHFYLFRRGPVHRLLAGPVDSRADLQAGAADRRRRGVVLRVPVGTTIASELPVDALGEPEKNAEPGWFALRDSPELTGSELAEVTAARDALGSPSVIFGFTERGRTAFRRVTRAIARGGRARTKHRVGASEAAALSGHLAIVVDGMVRARPIINFVENPNGIDGRTGAQISGGFGGIGEARELARTLKLGALPLNLTLVRQHSPD
jgi:SecD/SecF fusion protein